MMASILRSDSSYTDSILHKLVQATLKLHNSSKLRSSYITRPSYANYTDYMLHELHKLAQATRTRPSYANSSRLYSSSALLHKLVGVISKHPYFCVWWYPVLNDAALSRWPNLLTETAMWTRFKILYCRRPVCPSFRRLSIVPAICLPAVTVYCHLLPSSYLACITPKLALKLFFFFFFRPLS